jgi:hypothetical protein
MPKVSVYVRPTTGNRTPKKATKGSTGPFYLRYELNGKRIWESLTTRTYTFALADARSKESQLLRDEAHPPKPSPVLDSEVSGTIVSLREHFEAVRRGEIHRVRGRLGNLSSDQEDVVESLSRGIMEKVLQAPVAVLLNAAAGDQSTFIVETVRRIFNLQR